MSRMYLSGYVGRVYTLSQKKTRHSTRVDNFVKY